MHSFMTNMIVLVSGEKACVKCWKRPVMMRKTRTRNTVGWVPGSYCRTCATRDARERREGMIETLVSPAERDLLRELRGSSLTRAERDLLREIREARAAGAEVQITARPAGRHSVR